jgi:hypothetical protein
MEGYEHWLNKIGLLQQMRGIARFAWIFYYVINIVTFYKIYNWIKNFNPIIKVVICSIPLFLLCQDAYYNTFQEQDWINNPIPRLADKENKLPEDKWLTEINVKDYQAIISLPYFHVGSENVWMTSTSHIITDTYITSLQTGIPMLNVSMSRTSLSQTYKNIKIGLEPYRKLEITNDIKSKEPFLVLVEEKDLNDGERKLLSYCKQIKQTPLFKVYELNFADLDHISDNLYDRTLEIMDKSKTFKIGEYSYTDSIKSFAEVDFNEYDPANGFMDKGCYEGKIVNGCFLYNDTVPGFTKEQLYTVSFWMDNFTEDSYPRVWYILESFDEKNVSQSREVYCMKDKFKIVEGKKTLIESTILLKHKADKLQVLISGYNVPDEKMIFRGDNLLIRPTKDTLYKVDKNNIMMNNRTYISLR